MKLNEYFGIFESPFNLVEMINIESGKLAISSAPLLTKCSECPEASGLVAECDNCEINDSNLLAIRTGDGDGVYPVFQEWSANAVAVWFDNEYSLAHRAWSSPERGPAVEARLDSNIENMMDLEVFWAGTISASGPMNSSGNKP